MGPRVAPARDLFPNGVRDAAAARLAVPPRPEPNRGHLQRRPLLRLRRVPAGAFLSPADLSGLAGALGETSNRYIPSAARDLHADLARRTGRTDISRPSANRVDGFPERPSQGQRPPGPNPSSAVSRKQALPVRSVRS